MSEATKKPEERHSAGIIGRCWAVPAYLNEFPDYSDIISERAVYRDDIPKYKKIAEAVANLKTGDTPYIILRPAVEKKPEVRVRIDDNGNAIVQKVVLKHYAAIVRCWAVPAPLRDENIS